MFCPKCGKYLPEKSQACEYCGHNQERPRISNKAMLLAAIAALVSAISLLLSFLPGSGSTQAQDTTPTPTPVVAVASPTATPKPQIVIATPKPTQETESEPEPEPTPRPQRPRPEPEPTPSLKTRAIASGTHAINPGYFLPFPISVGSWKNPVVTGYFRASGGGRNDINVYIVDEDGLTNRKNGNSASTYYNAGRATVGQISAALPSLRPGNYYLVFDNGFSIISAKTITVYASISYSE